jgi:hypothetical protein
MESLGKVVGGVLSILLILIVVCVFLALPTMLLWNWLMPEIFGVKEVGFFQALGLNLLSGILFKSTMSTKNQKS